MKAILFLFIFLVTLKLANGQDDIARRDDSLQRILHQSISDSLRVKILEELHFLWKNKSYARSIEYSIQSIEFSEKHKPPEYTRGLRYQLAFAYMEAGDAVRSLAIFHQIVREVEGVKPLDYATALSFIGMNYEKQGNIKTALKYQQKANAIYEKYIVTNTVVDRRGYLGGPQQLAILFLKDNRPDSALYYGQLGLARLKNEKLNSFNKYFSWELKTTLGDIYVRLKEYARAKRFYSEAEQEAAADRYQPDLLTIYFSEAKLHFAQGDLMPALAYAKKTYSLADTLKLLPMVKEGAMLLKNIYVGMHQLDSAMYYYDLAMVARDSISNTDVARKLDEMEFAEVKRRQELASLKQEKSFRRNKLYLLCGISICILAALFLYYKNRLKQKANQLLEYENKEIFLQRDRLKQELASFEIQALKAQLNPHFIFNCLNSIDAFIYSNDKYRATMYLNKFARLLRNILDSSKNNTISLEKDIQSLQLYTELEELRNDGKFGTRYEIDEELLGRSYVVPPLIAQPLVENAILHGLKNKKNGKGVLIISIKLKGEKLLYQIIDNGIGRLASSRIPQHKEHSYGMELTKARIRMFNEEEEPSMTIEDLFSGNAPCGTSVSLTLNLQTT